MVLPTAEMTDGIDKIDMSLDDIIRLNKQEQNHVLFNGKAQTSSFQQFRSNRGRWDTQRQTGAGNMRVQGMKRHPYGAKMGLSMRKMSSWKGIGPLNRSPLSVRNSAGQRPPFRRRMNFSRPRDFGNKPASSLQRYNLNSNYSHANNFRRGLRMKQQRDTRQATYFLRRGLEVQTTLEKDQHEELTEITNRTSPWRTSMNSGGILTVSIDNPTAAVALPSSIGARLPRPTLPFLLKKEGSETKIPKGVPLDFDINSVAKQTGITLNERFKILKEQRLSQTISKGSRFVTVG